MDLVLVPLMMRDARWINESDDTPNTLEIKFHPDENSGQNSPCDGRPEPKEVMSGIDKVLVFLSEKFADKDLISRFGYILQPFSVCVFCRFDDKILMTPHIRDDIVLLLF